MRNSLFICYLANDGPIIILERSLVLQ